MNLAVELLSNTGYIMYNKALARVLGVNEAIMVENCVRGINTHLIPVFWWNTTAGFA